MFQATKAIYAELKTHDGLKVFTDESEKSSEVWLQFGISNGGSYRIKFISQNDGNAVAVRVFKLVNVDESKQEKVMIVLNNLNVEYRYVKFVLDDDGDVNVEYDYPADGSKPAESAYEIIRRFNDIIDKGYPKIMQALWA